MTETDQNDQIKELDKRVRFLERKLSRAEESLYRMEVAKDKTQQVLKKVNQEIEEARFEIQLKNEELEKLNKELETEKKKSDALLANILPEEVAEELKDTGRVKPVRFESVSILFTDYKGFTMIAEQMPIDELVTELDYCFSHFDRITDKYNLEKIKTIGDSYMCAGGLPVANDTHALDCVMAAAEFVKLIEKRRKEKAEKGGSYWQIRVGIHSGFVLAGVVGFKKFAYDIWGDTVNLASRMESSGEPGKINISSATYELVKDYFHCEYRGKIQAKNKGEVSMYFVESLMPEYKNPGDEFSPNAFFYEKFKSL